MTLVGPADEAELDELLSRPYPEVVDMFRRITGDIMLLGVGGKMGPTLARMAVRATMRPGPLPKSLESHGFPSRSFAMNWRVMAFDASNVILPIRTPLISCQIVLTSSSWRGVSSAPLVLKPLHGL